MKAFVPASLAAFGLALAAPVSAEDDGTVTRGEERLGKLLEGRVAGEPERCIRTLGRAPLRIIDGTAIVYKSGGTLWVNRTENPEDLDDNDRLVIRRLSASQLCRLDTVTTEDRYNDFLTGQIFLGDFVPYRRVDS